jgi:hypothetical protein
MYVVLDFVLMPNVPINLIVLVGQDGVVVMDGIVQKVVS